jgi:hypothetical protein
MSIVSFFRWSEKLEVSVVNKVKLGVLLSLEVMLIFISFSLKSKLGKNHVLIYVAFS